MNCTIDFLQNLELIFSILILKKIIFFYLNKIFYELIKLNASAI